MREKTATVISTALMIVPWSIFVLRANQWALESPAAEIIISCYAALMIAGGIWTAIWYRKKSMPSSWTKICLMVNGLYAFVGAAVFCMMAVTRWS